MHSIPCLAPRLHGEHASLEACEDEFDMPEQEHEILSTGPAAPFHSAMHAARPRVRSGERNAPRCAGAGNVRSPARGYFNVAM